MFYFKGTRIPNFKNITSVENVFDNYWENDGLQMRSKLMERENIFFDWILPGSKVLSIGCGNSRLLYELKKQKNCDVCGIDIAEEAINTLKQQGIKAYRANANEPIDFEKLFGNRNINFDYIIVSELLQQLSMPEKFVQNIKERTRYLILSIPNSAFYRYRMGLFFGGHFFTQWDKHPAETLRYWSHSDFLNWLKTVGLKTISVIPSNGLSFRFLKLYKIWPNLFGHQICYLTEV